jgi:hypothetical protein
MDCSSPSWTQSRSGTPPPPHYYLSGLVKDAPCGRRFVHDKELKRSFRDVFRSTKGEFYNTGIQRLTQVWQKCDESDGGFVVKQPHNFKSFTKEPCKFRFNALTFSEKK